MGIQMKPAEVLTHFSDVISTELKAFVTGEALIYSRYMFVRRVRAPFKKDSFQYGFCSHCKSDHMIKSSKTLKHDDGWQCENCRSLVIVKHAGRGRGKMIDRAYVVWYEKSHADPSAMIATGYKVTRDYRDKMEGETEFIPVARHLFQQGNATMMIRSHYISGIFSNRSYHYSNGWEVTAKTYSLIGKHFYTYHSYQATESISKAVQGTNFQYSPWEKFGDGNRDLVYFFSAAAKYPFIEYLYKMGMYDIVKSMVDRLELYRSINYRGKDMCKILGLSKIEIKAWKQSRITMTPLILHTFKWFRKRRVPITWELAASFESLVSISYYTEKLHYILKFAPLNNIVRYVTKQMNKDQKHHRSAYDAIGTWKDYLCDCETLKMDLTQERYLYPNNLHEAHQNSIRSIKLKEDRLVNHKISKLQKQLQKYTFELGELTIRPAVSSIELFDEGQALEHCVGRYADSYAAGKIAIMLIRRKDSPDTPYYTLELDLKQKAVRQCRGLENCQMTDEVKQFVDSFAASSVNTKQKRKTKESKLQPA